MAETEEKNEDLIEDKQISLMVYLKGFFLIGLVVFGMIIVNNISKRNAARKEEKVTSKTLSSLVSVKTLAKKYFAENLKKDGVYKTFEKSSGVVLGEATKAAESVAEKTTDTVTDFVYQHTLEVVIVNLIEKLPERQQKLFLDRLCKGHECMD